MSTESETIPPQLGPNRERTSPSESIEVLENAASALPAADRGPAAWKFLIGCFLIEAILWGKYHLLSDSKGRQVPTSNTNACKKGFP